VEALACRRRVKQMAHACYPYSPHLNSNSSALTTLQIPSVRDCRLVHLGKVGDLALSKVEATFLKTLQRLVKHTVLVFVIH